MAVYGVRVGVIMASRCSADAVSSCCKTAASFGCRHVHFARCIQTVPAPHRLHAQPQQGRTQWRCYASKVKDMPEKQLKGKQEAAEAGADDPAPNDHYDKVLEQLEKDSRDRMDKAVSNAREAMAKMTVRGIPTTLSCLAQIMSGTAVQCIAESCIIETRAACG